MSTTPHTPGPCIARVMPGGHYMLTEDETGRHIGTIHKDINPAVFAAAPELLEALQGLPQDVDMVEHNPDEGQSFFCCGSSTSINYGKLDHAPGCWYVAARAAIARATGEV